MMRLERGAVGAKIHLFVAWHMLLRFFCFWALVDFFLKPKKYAFSQGYSKSDLET